MLTVQADSRCTINISSNQQSNNKLLLHTSIPPIWKEVSSILGLLVCIQWTWHTSTHSTVKTKSRNKFAPCWLSSCRHK